MGKKQYRVRNWSDYNKALLQRGSVTLWFDEKSMAAWHKTKQKSGRGRPYYYGDAAIECALSLRLLFNLTLRSTQGFVASLAGLLHIDLAIPHYTTICRRQATLDVGKLHRKSKRGEPLHVVVDSSGIKIFGEGEWKIKMHGKSKCRTWRKLHIAVDADTQDIIAHEVTLASGHDTQSLPNLLDHITDPINTVAADGIYDTVGCYRSILNKKARPLIPPRKNAALSNKTDTAHQWRNYVVTQMKYHGLKTWKQHSQYHQRSLAETAFYRLKILFGHHAKNRRFDHQQTELALRCKLINQFNLLGLPQSVAI
jgi:hypothetical protein